MPLFFWFDLFLEARAEMQKYFGSFFGANENLKSPFEINWPLPHYQRSQHCHFSVIIGIVLGQEDI